MQACLRGDPRKQRKKRGSDGQGGHPGEGVLLIGPVATVGKQTEQAPPCHAAHGTKRLAFILGCSWAPLACPRPCRWAEKNAWGELGRARRRLSACPAVSTEGCGWGSGASIGSAGRGGGCHDVPSLGGLSCAQAPDAPDGLTADLEEDV